jgi:hypothetical protein
LPDLSQLIENNKTALKKFYKGDNNVFLTLKTFKNKETISQLLQTQHDSM